MKIDPYVNVDAGTMNPYMHGEVFVTDDGGETDLDLGWYERFLDLSLKQENNLTTGMVYKAVIEKERRGDFLGRCVQIIPHITNEIKHRIESHRENQQRRRRPNRSRRNSRRHRRLTIPRSHTTNARGRRLRKHALRPRSPRTHLDVTGEMKTKPLQHSVNELRRIGIQPDTIVARSPKMIDAEALRKIALFGTIPESAVFCLQR